MSQFKRFRSAITGLFVSKKKAAASPDTTVGETVWPKQAAFTEATGESYPAYINASHYPDELSIQITVRERGHDGNKSARIEMSHREVREFAKQLLELVQ